MNPIITNVQFTKLFPKAKQELITLFNEKLVSSGIDTLNRVSSFLAQTSHESGDYSIVTENLFYRAERLCEIFPSHFPKNADKSPGIKAVECAMKPIDIANEVYSNRKDLGNGPNDGYLFRGKGYIQLTGRANVTEFSKYVSKTVDETIKYLDTVEGCLMSAIWFWVHNNCNKFADIGDIKGQTKIINGGNIGLSDRIARFENIKDTLKSNFN